MSTYTVAAANHGDNAQGVQRPLCRLSSGRLITFVDNTTTWVFYYSDDEGQTWSQLTGTVAKIAATADHASIFATPDDEIHFLYDAATGVHYQAGLRTGTLSGTTITWGSAYGALPNIYGGDPYWEEGVFFRVATTTWCVVPAWEANSERIILYFHYKIDGGAWTYSETKVLQTGATSYGQTTVDFHHTGDGKTVQGGTPHIYVAWTVYGYTNLFFKKITYSGGVWTSGLSRGLANDASPVENMYDSPCLYFDGTRCVVSYYKGSAPYYGIVERDAADTTTTTRTPPTTGGAIRTLSLSHDTATNDIIVGAVLESDEDFDTVAYDRSAGSWGSWTERRAMTDAGSIAFLNRHRDQQATAVAITSDGAETSFVTADPFNAAPTAPTIDTPTSGSTADVAATLPIVWTFNDPDTGDTQSAYTLRRRIGTGAYDYWNGSTWQATEDGSTKIASATTSQTLASSWGADADADHYYAVKTWDALDAGPSPWSAETRVVPSAKDNPTITSPLTTVSDVSTSVTWTVSSQTKYRVQVFTDAGLTSSEYDSGVVISAATTHIATFPTEGTRYIWLQTWNDEGLASTVATEDVTVTYDVPPTPTLTATADTPIAGVIRVVIDNGTPGVGEDPATSNDVYRREGDDTTTAIRVATGVGNDGTWDDYTPASGVAYKYQIVAFAAIGTQTGGAWTA